VAQAAQPRIHDDVARAVKTIGVLGGVGPQATMDFEVRIHRVAQRLIPPRANAGYPPMVVYYCRHPPVQVMDDGVTARLPIRPDPRLLEAAARLGALADLLVITANGPYHFAAEIERASGRKVLSMIDATLDEVRRRGSTRVGVLGLGEPTIYTEPLGRLGIACETVGAEVRALIDAAVFQLMEGRDDGRSRAAVTDAVAELRARRVDAVILGCTEIPLLLRDGAAAADLINPAQLLAEAAVRAALE
jgi:aspartate racemase